MSVRKHPIISTVSLVLCTAMLLTACDSSEKSSNQSDTSSSQTESISDTSSTASEPQNSSVPDNSDNSEPGNVPDTSWLPRMDGSTSAAPLEIGLKSGFLGIPYNDAKELVSHTTTHDSFKRLIAGEVDLILSVPISEEQQKAADDAGVKLIMEPVAREGFVFVVNASNPVSSLTQEQLRKIYSGEITNWKQVGGNDEPILPYQRNTDSGSQNYMTVFMGDTELIPPKTDLVAVGMGGLMDAIAVYDNSAGAIGYSVYSYAAQMYANANKVKFIAIDGIEPSKATMADESYPLMSCTYAIYTDKSADSAKEFTEKMLSDEGQLLVLESGYLPVNGMEVPDKYLPYEAVGTGEPRPADYKRPEKYSRIGRYIPALYKKVQKDDRTYFEITFLKDEELQSQINADIGAAIDRLRGYTPPKNDIYQSENIDGMTMAVECYNGYMSLLIGYNDPDHDGFMGSAKAYYRAETLCYNLFTGKKLERFSDLFYKDEDFLPELNNSLNEYININCAPWYEDESKIDFSGLSGEQRLFTLNGVLLEPDNLYFTYAPLLEFSQELTVTWQYRDMTELFAEEYHDNVIDYEYYYPEWETEYVREDGDIYKRYVGSDVHTEAEVKAEDEFWYGLQKRAWEALRTVEPDFHTDMEVRVYNEGNYYSVGVHATAIENDRSVNFDADTLEIITMEDLLGSDWLKYFDDEYKGIADGIVIPCSWGHADEEGMVWMALRYSADVPGFWGVLKVPQNAINERYARNY